MCKILSGAKCITFKSKVRHRSVLCGVLQIYSMMVFPENGLCRSHFLPQQPYKLPDDLSMDGRNCSVSISQRRMSAFSHSSCKMTDSSLFGVKKLLCFMVFRYIGYSWPDLKHVIQLHIAHCIHSCGYSSTGASPKC